MLGGFYPTSDASILQKCPKRHPILARHTQHICRLALKASSLGPQVFIGATRQGTPVLLVCWSVGFAIWVQFEMKFVSSIWVALAIHVSFHIYWWIYIYIYMWHIVTHMIYVLFMCRSYVSYFWVNYNDLTVLPHYNHSRGNDPQMAELFRLVKYSNWPRYFFWWSPVDHFIFWMDSTKPSSSRWTRGQLQPGTAQDHVQAIMERLLKSVDGDIWHILSTIIIYIYIIILYCICIYIYTIHIIRLSCTTLHHSYCNLTVYRQGCR